MTGTRFVLVTGILLVTAFVFSCGEVGEGGGSRFCGESLSEYDASTQFCLGEEVHDKCNGMEYNPLNSFCYNNIIYEKCNGDTINVKTSFCYKNEVYAKCDGKIYNPSDNFCYNRSVIRSNKESCSKDTSRYSEKYDTSKEFCFMDTVSIKGDTNYVIAPLCNDMEYDPLKQFCYEDQRYPKCKNAEGKYMEYDPLDQGCFGGILYDNCRLISRGACSYENNPRCKQNSKIIEPYSGMTCEQNSEKILGEVKHNNISYKTVQIGRQVWIAENLRKDGDDKYDWATAMSLAPDCNTDLDTTIHGTNDFGNPTTQVRAKNQACREISSYEQRRGLCPEGWRIPNNEEWQELIDYAGGTYIAAEVLKSVKDWSNDYSGSDKYGFNAKPDSEDAALAKGYWWTSTVASGLRDMAISWRIEDRSINPSSRSKNAYEYPIRCLRNTY
jgi:uncharacterized protein (TIGR02145 family)